MTVKYSERKVREALTDMDLELEVYKPPDSPHATNQRPCDFMVWWIDSVAEVDIAKPAWIEVKENDALNTFAWSLLRPSQVAAMRRAVAIGLPYFVVTYWKRSLRRADAAWSITRASRILDLLDLDDGEHATSARWDELTAIEGIEVNRGDLASMLRLALLGEV